MLLDYNGVRLQVESEGDGYPCLVPAFLGLPMARLLLPEAVRQRLRLVYVGVDFGEAPMEPVSVTDTVQWLETVRLALDLGSLAVLAHSAIGMLPLAYAQAYPQAVTHAVAVAAGTATDLTGIRERYWDACATPERRVGKERDVSSVDRGALSRLPEAEAFVRHYVNNRALYFYNPDFDAERMLRGVSVNLAFMARFFGWKLDPFDQAIEWERIRCPVLVVLGRYDFVMPPTVWDVHRDRLSRGQVCVFETSGHWPPLEEPERFTALLLRFLADSLPAS